MTTVRRLSTLPTPACFGVIRTQTTLCRGVGLNSRLQVVRSQDSKQDDVLEDMESTNQGPKDFWEVRGRFSQLILLQMVEVKLGELEAF
jgi:hypothetical protein